MADALARLDKAVGRIDQASGDVPELRKLGDAHQALKDKLADSERQRGILREAVNRVSARLDHQIERLSGLAED